EHKAALGKCVQDCVVPKKEPSYSGLVLTSRNSLVRIDKSSSFVIIGERINPTGKKQLTADLQNHVFTSALHLVDEQIAQGAQVLDVNVGAPLVDEEAILPELVQLLVGRVQTPLSLDSSNPKAIAAALPYCPGSALVNSINGEGERLDFLGPLCKKFGAPFVLLPLAGSDLPVKAKMRIAIVEKILARCEDLGIPRHLILVDILALTVSANAEGGLECLKMLDFCREQRLSTTCGLSNISFGLPARELVNATFLAMAAGCGLTSCIANPMNSRIQEAVSTINLLRNQDLHAQNFIANFANWTTTSQKTNAPKEAVKAQNLYQVVLQGDKENVLTQTDQLLQKGQEPFTIVQDILIPAITEVGKKYERREYFLPQLIRSAETMQMAFTHLKPLLEQNHTDVQRPVVVMATVEGDIHDIGKNIVCLLLGNHGFEVVDLGKDVSADTIVKKAVEKKAKIIGLSALMTTTMVKMAETIDLVRAKQLPIKVMVGGACVTESFAERIGADAYCSDAVMAVRRAQELVRSESV
ncbi:MAG: dihydropteroate synthase, partial [Desulfovibrio sp.]|nr:dihydropteroate synthase [Desulfovibrio sp.]